MRTLDLPGLAWPEAFEALTEEYALVRQQSEDQLDVIHGYGSTGVGGTLRARLRGFLQRQGDSLEFMPGEDVDGNPGHTIVIPEGALPGECNLLAERVWAYCQRPKSFSKIVGRFRKSGQPKVREAVESLVKKGGLRTLNRGRLTTYEAKADDTLIFDA